MHLRENGDLEQRDITWDNTWGKTWNRTWNRIWNIAMEEPGSRCAALESRTRLGDNLGTWRRCRHCRNLNLLSLEKNHDKEDAIDILLA